MYPRPQDYTDDAEIQQILSTIPPISYGEFGLNKAGSDPKDPDSYKLWQKRLFFYLQGMSREGHKFSQEKKSEVQE